MKFFADIFVGLYSLLMGMSVTIREFFNKNLTIQYPEQRAVMHKRFRGRVSMLFDENGVSKCTACGLCPKACPNASIEVLSSKREGSPRKVLDKYIYNLSTCTLCGLCIEACNFDAIEMAHDYELATFDRQNLTIILNEVKDKTKQN